MQQQPYISNERGYTTDGINEPLPQNVGTFERVVTSAIGALMVYSAIKNITRRPFRSIGRLGAGGALLARGISGYCPVYDKLNIDGNQSQSVNIRTNFVVDKPKMEVYRFWRKLENLPLFMKHLSSVRETDSLRSHWEARIPEGNPIAIKWDAEIVKDEEGALLSWKSLPGSTIDNAGKIEFHDALGDRGTELRIMITYRPPAGNIGTGIAKLFNPLFEKLVRQDVNNFKSFIDTQSPAMASQPVDRI